MTPADDGGPRGGVTRLLTSAAAVTIVIAGMKATSDIVGPVFLALALTILFQPLRRRLERRLPTWLASLLVLVGVYALVLGLVLAMVVSLGRFADLVPQYADEIDLRVGDVGDWLVGLGVGQDQASEMTEAADPSRLVDTATSVLGAVLGVVSVVAFVVTLLFFMVLDGAHATAWAQEARAHRARLVDALDSFARGTRTYLGVSATFGLIVAAIDTLVLWALGVPGAFVWGVLAFVTNFVPNIGFVIGLLPPATVALLEGGPGQMLLVIVLYCLVNFVIQSLIQPRYVGQAVGLSPVLTFLSLVFWTWVLGPLGAILAVPVSLLCKAVLVESDPERAWLDRMISGRPRAGETTGETTF